MPPFVFGNLQQAVHDVQPEPILTIFGDPDYATGSVYLDVQPEPILTIFGDPDYATGSVYLDEPPFNFGPPSFYYSSTPWLTVMDPIAVGGALPNRTVLYLDEQDQLQWVSIHSLAKGKKVIIFGVAGAFAPPCRQAPRSHLMAVTGSLVPG